MNFPCKELEESKQHQQHKGAGQVRVFVQISADSDGVKDGEDLAQNERGINTELLEEGGLIFEETGISEDTFRGGRGKGSGGGAEVEREEREGSRGSWGRGRSHGGSELGLERLERGASLLRNRNADMRVEGRAVHGAVLSLRLAQ